MQPVILPIVMWKKNSSRVPGWPTSSIIASPASFLLNLMVDGVNYCFGLLLLPLVETFDVGSASVSLVCFVLERFGQATLGSWESSQRSLINNNMLMLTQVGSLCVGILSLLAPGTAWLTDRFGARLVQNFTLHLSNPNTAAAISILFGEGLKTKTSVESFIGIFEFHIFLPWGVNNN